MAKKKKQHSSKTNYDGYLQGKNKLKHAVIQHPDEGPNSIFDFIQSEAKNNRGMWVVPYKKWEEKQKKY